MNKLQITIIYILAPFMFIIFLLSKIYLLVIEFLETYKKWIEDCDYIIRK